MCVEWCARAIIAAILVLYEQCLCGQYCRNNFGRSVVGLLTTYIELVKRSGCGKIGASGGIVVSQNGKASGGGSHDTIGSTERCLVGTGTGGTICITARSWEIRDGTQPAGSSSIASGLAGVLVKCQLSIWKSREGSNVVGRDVGTGLDEKTFDCSVNPVSHRAYRCVGGCIANASAGSIGGATEIRKGGIDGIS